MIETKQTYTDNCAPTNLQYESRGLMTDIKTVRKKTERQNIIKNKCLVSLRHKILKV